MTYKKEPIKDFPGYSVDTNGIIYAKNGQPMKQTYSGQGRYPSVCLFKNGKIKQYVHRLMAQTFIPNPENKKTVNHIDGNKQNNTIGNLEWATATEQNNHAVLNKLAPLGEKHKRSKLTEKEVLEIRKSKKKQIQLARLYGVSPMLISVIVRRKIWKHI